MNEQRTDEMVKELIKNGALPAVEFQKLDDGRQMLVVLDKAIEVHALPDNPNAKRYIPPKEKFKNLVMDESFLMAAREAISSLEKGNIFESLELESETGVSKSTVIEWLAAMTNTPYIPINHGPGTREGDLIGRFLPTDSSLRDKWEELIESVMTKKYEPKDQESVEIIRNAYEVEKRQLELHECLKIAANEKLDPKMLSNKSWNWHNGPLYGGMIYGAWVVCEERNLSGIQERFNGVIAEHPSMIVSEHAGEVIRELTVEESKFVQDGGELPGIKKLHDTFRIIVLQNPSGYQGRVEESPASKDRPRVVPLHDIKQEDFRAYTKFAVTGIQHDFVFNGVRYIGVDPVSGAGQVEAPYAEITAWANEVGVDIEKVMEKVADIHWAFRKLAETNDDFGVDKRNKGGAYTYTRRGLIRFMDHLRNAFVVDMQYRLETGRIRNSTNLRDRMLSAIDHVWISTVYEADKELAKKVIEVSGILDLIGPDAADDKLEQWARDARKKGMAVTSIANSGTIHIEFGK